MKTAMTKMFSGLLAGGLLASGAYAAPLVLNNGQMDSVAAGGVETVSGFVCTVNTHYQGLATAAEKANTDAVGFGGPITGVNANGNTVTYYTVAPSGAGNLNVPVQATNTGTPGGGFSVPGDTTYSPIWNRANF